MKFKKKNLRIIKFKEFKKKKNTRMILRRDSQLPLYLFEGGGHRFATALTSRSQYKYVRFTGHIIELNAVIFECLWQVVFHVEWRHQARPITDISQRFQRVMSLPAARAQCFRVSSAWYHDSRYRDSCTAWYYAAMPECWEGRRSEASRTKVTLASVGESTLVFRCVDIGQVKAIG